MSSAKKSILISLFVIIIIAIAYFGYNFYRQIKEPVLPAIKAIPPNASIILETNKLLDTWEKISNGNNLWNDLITIDKLKKIDLVFKEVDSVINTDKGIKDIINSETFYISIHTSPTLQNSLLFLLNLESSRDAATLKKFIGNYFPEKVLLSHETFKGTEIYTIEPEKDKLFFYSVYKGVLIGSPDNSMVKNAIEQMNDKNNITHDIEFQKVRSTKGKKVDANIYINYRNLSRTLQSLTKNSSEFIHELKHLAQWSEVDLIIKKDELLLNGYTATKRNPQAALLDIFQGQSPQRTSITNMIPSNTTYFLAYNFENFPDFSDSIFTYQQRDSLYNSLKPLIKRFFYPWIDTEAAVFITEPIGEEINSGTIVIIRARNIEVALSSLDTLNYKTNKEGIQLKEDYREYVIKKIEEPGLMKALLGIPFSALRSNYYTTYDGFVVFANNISALKKYINLMLSDKNLASNENYILFSDNITEKTNIYFYLNIRKSIPIFQKYANNELSDLINSSANIIKNFEAFSVQYSSNADLFYTNFYLKYNSSFIEEKSFTWETRLDGEVIAKPFQVTDHTNNTKKILAFDDNQQMYMVNMQGDIIWKIKLAENIISNVHQVDYYKNGKIQYLFNTENYLYLIDLNGNNVADYPVKLPARATNGVAVFDYNNRKDYRIFIACDDNRIYNLDINGKNVRGWNKVKTKGNVSVPVQHYISSKKDYIIIEEDNGIVHIVNRRGNRRINISKNPENSIRSDIYLNKTNSRGLFLTTNVNGELIYLGGKGVSKTTFGDFSKNHYFLYEDINSDGNNDFIFLDKDKITAFDRFKKILFQHTFENDITSKPEYFQLSDKESIIGIIDPVNEVVCLMNSDGMIENGLDIKGASGFIIEKDKKSDSLIIITTQGSSLFRYDQFY